jgi:hypothetical protein
MSGVPDTLPRPATEIAGAAELGPDVGEGAGVTVADVA